jgi:hypothetical protein
MMEAPLGNSINSVAVTYNPDTDLLAQILESAAPQVQGGCGGSTMVRRMLEP